MSSSTPSKAPEELETPNTSVAPPPTSTGSDPAEASVHSSAGRLEESGGDGALAEDGEAELEGEEEEAECGFCLFMKGGGCKDPFVAWEKCVEDAEKSGEDVVDKCFEVTSLLKKCMDAHADYYEPVLRAEQAMADAVAASGDEPEPESLPETAAPDPKPEALD